MVSFPYAYCTTFDFGSQSKIPLIMRMNLCTDNSSRELDRASITEKTLHITNTYFLRYKTLSGSKMSTRTVNAIMELRT